MKKLFSTFLVTLISFTSYSVFANINYQITAEGVGPVKIGMTASQLPSSVNGLYDKIIEENSDMVLYSFYLNGETVMITNGDSKIELIEVFPSRQNVSTADGVHPGMSQSEFNTKSGWSVAEGDAFTKDGVTIYIQDGEITNMQIGFYEGDDW